MPIRMSTRRIDRSRTKEAKRTAVARWIQRQEYKGDIQNTRHLVGAQDYFKWEGNRAN